MLSKKTVLHKIATPQLAISKPFNTNSSALLKGGFVITQSIGLLKKLLLEKDKKS